MALKGPVDFFGNLIVGIQELHELCREGCDGIPQKGFGALCLRADDCFSLAALFPKELKQLASFASPSCES